MDFKILKWKLKGSPAPPPHAIKIRTIDNLRSKFQPNTFIETGTWRGDMIEAQKSNFSTLHSIELSEELHKKAEERFDNDDNVSIHQGDSGKVLKNIIKSVDTQALFWLDGHYSGGETALGDKECPIIEELQSIFEGNIKNHVILIDDARCFTGEGDYPTIETLESIIKNYNPEYQIKVENDIIIAEPR